MSKTNDKRIRVKEVFGTLKLHVRTCITSLKFLVYAIKHH